MLKTYRLPLKSQLEHITVIFFLLSSILSTCPERTCSKIDDNLNPVCDTCSPNCLVCYGGLHKSNICSFCEEGYMLDNDLSCKPCAENCSRCDGPKLEECHTIKSGFYLNDPTQKLEPCNEDCAKCFDKDRCVTCAEGYYISEKKVNENNIPEVTCIPCNIPNCTFCTKKADQIVNNEYLTCTFCENKYAVVSGHCEKCPVNCKYCKPDTLECTFCENGFSLNKNTNICEPLTVENCYSMNEKGFCIMCDAHFYLEESVCVPCAKKKANCTYCTTRAEIFLCLSCEAGFFKTNDDNCQPCIDKCLRCSEERCFSCENNYFYNADSRSCELCQIDNCQSCQTSTMCAECLSGFYFDSDTKKCEK